MCFSSSPDVYKRQELIRVRREKLAALQSEGSDPFQITKYDVSHHSAEIKAQFDQLEGETVTVAGRMMSKRVMGKASFCNVQDLSGNIQSYVAVSYTHLSDLRSAGRACLQTATD